MAAPVYDVWLTATDRVYKGVPYTVLADWVQQGRVLPADRLRGPGDQDWKPVAELDKFRVFLPRTEPHAADDAAEALIPVETDIPIRGGGGDEDDDVDMIPLIDISLVLLIFFMMTATVAVTGFDFPLAEAKNGTELASDPSAFWVAVDRGPNGPVYSFGQGDRGPADADVKLSEDQLLTHIKDRIAELGTHKYDIRIAGHKELPTSVLQKLAGELEKVPGVGAVKAQVTERAP